MTKLSDADIALIFAETVDDIKQALQNGARINACNEDGWNALMVATKLDNVKFLVETGANVSEKIIEEQKDDEIKKYLQACMDLLNADTIEKAEKALADGAYIDARDCSGNTALILTARRTGTGDGVKEEIEKHLEFLLNKGANINAENNFKSTAIMSVSTKNKALILLNNKADFNLKNAKGTTGKNYLITRFKMTEEEIEKISKETVVKAAGEKKYNKPHIVNTHFRRPNNNAEKEQFARLRVDIQKRLLNAENKEAVRAILDSDDVKKVVQNIPAKIDDITDARGRNVLMRLVSLDLGEKWPLELRKKQINLFIRCGANINARDEENGKTSLVFALNINARNEQEIKDKKELIKHLVLLGADINITYKEGNVYLSVYKCAQRNDMEEVIDQAFAPKNTLKLLDNLLNNPDFSEISKDTVFDWNITDKCGRTAIMLAAKNKNIEALKNLYEAGAFQTISVKDKFGNTVFDHAEDAEVKKYIQTVVEKANRELLCADTPEKVKEALSHGADINTVNITGQNALMLALDKGRNDVAECLLKEGIDITAKDDCGKTALMYVQSKEQAVMVRKAGAQINVKDNKGNTVFQHISYIPKCEEITEYLNEQIQELNNKLFSAQTPDELITTVNQGADINATDEFGRNILMTSWSDQLAETAIALGANVNEKDNNGLTALMHAFTPERTALLIKAGANVNEKDDNGCTALMHAKSIEQMRLLIKAGADILAKDNAGNTVFDHFKEKDGFETYLKDERLEHDPQIQDFIHRREMRLKIEQYKKTHKILAYKKRVLSGVVVADRIAESVIAKEETRVITPMVGKQIRQDLIRQNTSNR